MRALSTVLLLYCAMLALVLGGCADESDTVSGESDTTYSIEPDAQYEINPDTNVFGLPATGVPREDSVDAAIVDPYELNDRLEEMLDPGRMVYNPPETMMLGEKETLELLVSADTAKAALRDALPGSDAVVDTLIRVTPSMTAELRALTSGLRVTRRSPEEQLVGRRTPAHWRWQVEAVGGGEQVLGLELNALLRMDSGELRRKARVFSNPIRIQVTAAQQLGIFFRRNWGWLLSLCAILVPIVLWYADRQGKGARREEETAESESEPTASPASPASQEHGGADRDADKEQDQESTSPSPPPTGAESEQ